MPHIRFVPIIVVVLLWTACAGGGTSTPDGPYYPPVKPRHPERLVLSAPSESDPHEWWRLNVYSHVGAEIYPDSAIAEYAAQVIVETNRARAEMGLQPVTELTGLNRVAQAHAWDQALRDYWAHPTPEGLGSRDRIAAASLGTVRVGGENSAIDHLGNRTPAELVARLAKHPGHRELLFDPDVKYIGIGIDYYEPTDWVRFVQLLVDFEE